MKSLKRPNQDQTLTATATLSLRNLFAFKEENNMEVQVVEGYTIPQNGNSSFPYFSLFQEK